MNNSLSRDIDPIIVCLTGASGIGYGIRLIKALVKFHTPPYLILSKNAELVAKAEMGIDLSEIKKLAKKTYFHENMASEVASGSFRVGGIVVCPCSMKTLGLIAQGIESNLIVRSVMCQLKEGRKTIIVPRETPLSLPIIENMKIVLLSGAVILPAMPGFYHNPKSIKDLENFIVGKILDQFNIKNDLFKRWGSN